MTEPTPARAPVDTLRESLDGVHTVMLVSELDGLHARPLTMLNVDEAGGLWFLVDAGELWVRALVEKPLVAVTADVHRDGRFVSVSGVAVLSDDRVAIHGLWTPAAAAFWGSADDPSIRVLRVDPTVVDVWRTAPSAIGRVLAIGKAILTGDSDSDGDSDGTGDSEGAGEHEHVVLARP